MQPREEILELLKSRGACLVRTRKHDVWKFPNGYAYTLPRTPSDHRAWQNCLADLKHRLGLAIPQKTQLDFEHRKKEAYEKPIEQKQEFLAGLQEPEDRPKTPISVSPLDRLEEPPPREIIPLYGRIPIAPGKRGGGSKGPRSGDAYTFSAEIMQRASYLLHVEGSAAVTRYLNDVRNNRNPTFIPKEEKAMSQTEVSDKMVSHGSIEEIIRQKREEIRSWRAQADAALLEVSRAEKVLEALEQALSLTTASKAVIQASNGSHSSATTNKKIQKPKGFWRTEISEIVGTHPFTLRKASLMSEIEKLHPTASTGAAYQAMLKGIRDGWITEDKEGLIRLGKEAK